MSLNNGDGFDLGFKIDGSALTTILQKANVLTPTEIADLSLKLSMSNPKLKALVSLFANFIDITGISTVDKIIHASPFNILEFEIARSETTKGSTHTASMGLTTDTSIWSIIGVDLKYKKSIVTSLVGANYTSGRPVATVLGATTAAAAGATPAGTPVLGAATAGGGGRTRARRPYRRRRKYNRSSKRQSF